MTYSDANYRLLATLNGQHNDTIACMQFSPCGEYLVTGGDDLRMNVFHCTDNFKNILSIDSTSPASAICWNPTTPKSCFVGYSGGAIVSHTFGNYQEDWAGEILLFNGRCRVVSLAWDNLLAIATERNVFLIDVTKTGTDGQRGPITIPPPATNHGQPEPRAVCFTPGGLLIIAYLEDGVVCWSPDGRTLKWTFTPRALRIGRFFYSPNLEIFVVHNLYDGFDAYTMKSRAHFRSYRFPASEECNVPLSCVLINDGRHIVCGTTSGKAVVLDAITQAHQANLHQCYPGLVQEIAYCNKNGVNILATTASERGEETTIKIWAADVLPCQSIGYADRITEVFRGVMELLGDLCTRIIRWRSRKVEIPLFSLIFWASVLITMAIGLSCFNAATFEGFGLTLLSACRSIWSASKDAFLTNGRMLQKTLTFSVRACYLFLKGFLIALYEFLEEGQPYPPTNSIGSISAESSATPGDSLNFRDVLGERGPLATNDVSGVQDDHSLDWVAVPAQVEWVVVPEQTDSSYDPEVSVGFSGIEAHPTKDDVTKSNELPVVDGVPAVCAVPGVDKIPEVGGAHGMDYQAPAVGDDPEGLPDRGVVTDIQVHRSVTTDLQIHTGRFA